MAELECLAESRGELTTNVVFVHGLGGNIRTTWQADRRDEATLWPLWLAEDIPGHAIWSVGYPAAISRWRGTAMHLVDRARNVFLSLRTEPKLAEGRLILIGHSLGGLVIKRMLLDLVAEAESSKAAASFLDRVDKVSFLATPHAGSDYAVWGDWFRVLVWPSEATRCLLRRDPNLLKLNVDYRRWATTRGLHHLVLRESQPVRILGYVVDPESGDPGFVAYPAEPLDKGHISIVKPPNRADEVYKSVKAFILDPFERPVTVVEQKIGAVIASQEAIREDTRSILEKIEAARQAPDIAVEIGEDSFSVIVPGAKPARSELEIGWRELSDAVAPDDIDLLAALRWNFRLATKLHGRDDDLKQILAWAEAKPGVPSIRLVTGEGGAGKTRLAAEVAAELRRRGWTAGFLRPGHSLQVPIGDARGLLLILDYPEESPDLARRLFAALTEAEQSAFPLRLLLLSRRDFAHWENEALPLGGRFGKHPIAAPDALDADEAVALISEAATTFAGRACLPLPNLERAESWASENTLHRLPLFVLAAAVHAVLSPDAAFGIEGGAIIRDLAERERGRVRRASDRLGIGPASLERLLALGIVAEGLDFAAVRALAQAGIGEGIEANRLLKVVSETPWWRGGRLVRLQPDRVAACFLDAALFEAKLPDGDDRLPHWLSLSLKGNERDFGDRLGRLLYDLDAPGVARNGATPLEAALIAMIEREPERVVDFAEVASGEVPFAAAGFAAEIAGRLGVDLKDHPEQAALFLNNSANYLSLLGRLEAALEAAQEAVEISRALAEVRPDSFTPALAISLNNLGKMLSDLGRREAALDAAQEASGLYRALAKAHPDSFTPYLAGSLTNLSKMLSELGRREAALETAQEAVEIGHVLANARLDAFAPVLATSLSSLGKMLSDLGRREEALEVAREAVKIRRALAKARPDAFAPDLASSLNTLGALLSDQGRREEALEATGEAVEIWRPLTNVRPDAFTPDLAASLNNLGKMLSGLGYHEAALEAGHEATRLYRALAKASSDAFVPYLATSLNNLSNWLSELGQRESALEAAQEAVEIRRALAMARPDSFTPALASSLNNLGNRLSELGRRESALEAAQEAVEIMRALAKARPDSFTPDLAMSLNNFGTMLSDLGRREAALAAALESVKLYGGLGREHPAAFARELFAAMHNLAEYLSALGREEEAEAVRCDIAELFAPDEA